MKNHEGESMLEQVGHWLAIVIVLCVMGLALVKVVQYLTKGTEERADKLKAIVEEPVPGPAARLDALAAEIHDVRLQAEALAGELKRTRVEKQELEAAYDKLLKTLREPQPPTQVQGRLEAELTGRVRHEVPPLAFKSNKFYVVHYTLKEMKAEQKRLSEARAKKKARELVPKNIGEGK